MIRYQIRKFFIYLKKYMRKFSNKPVIKKIEENKYDGDGPILEHFDQHQD